MTAHLRYCCPDCDQTVWHSCLPNSYWEGRLLRRYKPIPRLRYGEEKAEDDRKAWARAKLGPIADSLEDALGDAALLPVDDFDVVASLEEE